VRGRRADRDLRQEVGKGGVFPQLRKRPLQVGLPRRVAVRQGDAQAVPQIQRLGEPAFGLVSELPPERFSLIGAGLPGVKTPAARQSSPQEDEDQHAIAIRSVFHNS